MSLWPTLRTQVGHLPRSEPVARFGASDCAFLRGACCASDQLAHVLAKGRSLKRRDLFTIHPQQGGLVRADHLFRGSPFFGSLLRHGTPLPCPCYFLTPRRRASFLSFRQKHRPDGTFQALSW